MLEKEEYHEAYHKGKKFILCDRLDMIEDIEKELLQGAVVAYKCEADRGSIFKWKEMYERLTNATFVFCSARSGGTFVKHRNWLKCIHREQPNFTREMKRAEKRSKKVPPKKPIKYVDQERGNSKCPVTITAIVKIRKSLREKKLTDGYFLHVHSNCMSHNHSREAALKCRPVAHSTKTALLELFDQGHAPSTALQVLKQRLLEKHGDSCPSVMLDRSFLPDMRYVTRLYYSTYRSRYGNLSRKEVRRVRKMKLEQSGTAVASGTAPMEQSHDMPNVEECVAVNTFSNSEELPANWYAGSDEALTSDTSWEETSALGTENAYAATSGVDDALAVADTPAADGPSIAETASHIRRWAACVSREVALDASGQWRNAAAAFIQQWERLPATSKLKELQEFGRTSARAPSLKGDDKPASGVCGTAIDSGDYRSVTVTDVRRTGTENGICTADTDQMLRGRNSGKGKRQRGASSRRSATALCVIEKPLDV